MHDRRAHEEPIESGLPPPIATSWTSADNPDEQNRDIALRSLITAAVNKERKKDLDLYKTYAGDSDFRKSFEEAIIRILALHQKSKPA